jgi:hypothetical protein
MPGCENEKAKGELKMQCPATSCNSFSGVSDRAILMQDASQLKDFVHYAIYRN